MFKSTKEFNKEIYNVLVKIKDESNWKQPPSNIDEIDFADVIEHIIMQGLVNGISGEKMSNGIFRFDHTLANASPRLTHKGLIYIENFKD
jgi:hypothetical protein